MPVMPYSKQRRLSRIPNHKLIGYICRFWRQASGKACLQAQSKSEAVVPVGNPTSGTDLRRTPGRIPAGIRPQKGFPPTAEHLG